MPDRNSRETVCPTSAPGVIIADHAHLADLNPHSYAQHMVNTNANDVVTTSKSSSQKVEKKKTPKSSPRHHTTSSKTTSDQQQPSSLKPGGTQSKQITPITLSVTRQPAHNLLSALVHQGPGAVIPSKKPTANTSAGNGAINVVNNNNNGNFSSALSTGVVSAAPATNLNLPNATGNGYSHGLSSNGNGVVSNGNGVNTNSGQTLNFPQALSSKDAEEFLALKAE